MTDEGYKPREYMVIKMTHPGLFSRALVVAQDLEDPDIWALINSFDTAREAWEYVRMVEARNRILAREVGCAT